MAQMDLTSGDWKSPHQDALGNPFGWLSIGDGLSTAFTCLVLNLAGVSYYYWPNTSGVLRYGTTAPTVATQDTAGAAV